MSMQVSQDTGAHGETGLADDRNGSPAPGGPPHLRVLPPPKAADQLGTARGVEMSVNQTGVGGTAGGTGGSLPSSHRVEARWMGWCAGCHTGRPLLLVSLRPRGLRAWIQGWGPGDGTLSYTCGVCGRCEHVPWDEADDPAWDLTLHRWPDLVLRPECRPVTSKKPFVEPARPQLASVGQRHVRAVDVRPTSAVTTQPVPTRAVPTRAVPTRAVPTRRVPLRRPVGAPNGSEHHDRRATRVA